MRRRQFIAFGSGATLGVGAILAGSAVRRSDSGRGSAETGFLELGRALVGVAGVGLGYLGLRQRRPSVRSLVDELLGAFWLQREEPITQSELRALVRHRIRSEYAAARLVAVAGWLLAETECRLAALNALIRGHTAVSAAAPTAANAREETFLDVAHWGPQETRVGQPFNVQPDGHAGLWFVVAGAPRSLQLLLGDRRITTTVFDDRVTAGVHDPILARVLAEPGRHDIVAWDRARHRRQRIGSFIVSPAPERAVLADGSRARVFCPIEAWGPQIGRFGEPFNAQPDGTSALWVRTPCAPDGAQLLLGGRALDTTLSPGLVTARVPSRSLPRDPGGHRLELVDAASGERLLVGEFVLKR